MKKIGRNDKCPCGSGLKYKKCCMSVNRTSHRHSSLVNRTRVSRLPIRGESPLEVARTRVLSRVVFNAMQWVNNNFHCGALYGQFHHNGDMRQTAYVRVTTDKEEEILLLVEDVDKFTFVSRQKKNPTAIQKEMQRTILRPMKEGQ